jgi:hypothetical protein
MPADQQIHGVLTTKFVSIAKLLLIAERGTVMNSEGE